MEKFTNEGYGLIRELSGLKASPDGRHAVYTVRTMNIAEDCYETSIWLADVQAHTELRLTAGPHDGGACWLDNERVLFTRAGAHPERETVLYCISVHGGEATPYLTIPVPGAMAFRVDDERWIVLTDEDRNTDAPAKNWIYYDEYPMHVEGQGYASRQRTTAQLFTRSNGELKPLLDPMMHVMMPFFTPAVVTDAEGFWFAGTCFDRDRNGQESVYYYRFADGQLTELLSGPYYIYSFSRANGRITAGAWLYSTPRVGTMEIVCVDETTGANKKVLTPGWQMESNAGLYFTQVDCARQRLCRWLADGSIEVIATHGVYPNVVAPLADGNVLLSGWQINGLPEVYLLANGELTQLSHQNDALWSKYTFSAMQSLQVKGVDGWVIPPVGMEKGRKYPVILTFHGGPHGYYGERFHSEMQRWANEGYFVVFCNPHGSTSYGVEFASISGRMGQTDYREVMDFLDGALAAWPEMDETRMAVTGQSYGGYLTNWIITQTDRFKAASPRMAISNWISMRGTSDEKWYLDACVGADPWSNLELVWEQSPLKYVQQAKTPTLFIQHEKDNSVPVEQAEQMFVPMKENGVPCRLMINLGCGHGGRKVSHLLHDIDIMMDWFAKYLA